MLRRYEIEVIATVEEALERWVLTPSLSVGIVNLYSSEIPLKTQDFVQLSYHARESWLVVRHCPIARCLREPLSAFVVRGFKPKIEKCALCVLLSFLWLSLFPPLRTDQLPFSRLVAYGVAS